MGIVLSLNKRGSLHGEFLYFNLFDEDFVELVHVILSKLNNGAHVLFVFQPERFVDPNEDHASSLTIVHDRSFRSGVNIFVSFPSLHK